MQSIAITGAMSSFGLLIIQHLLKNESYRRILALDSKSGTLPDEKILTFQVDVGHPLTADILTAHDANVLLHLSSIRSTEKPFLPRDESEVSRMVKILATAVSARLDHIIITSHAVVYGPKPTHSSYISEDSALFSGTVAHYAREKIEMEQLCSDFQRKHPEIKLTILRFASLLGSSLDMYLTEAIHSRYFCTVLGYDPLLQFLHPEDAVQAIERILQKSEAGAFNVASANILPLMKFLRLADTVPVPLLKSGAAIALTLKKGLQQSPFPSEMLDFLKYPCVLSTEKLRETLGFEAQYSAEETVKNYITEHCTEMGRGESRVPRPEYATREPIIDTLYRRLYRSVK